MYTTFHSRLGFWAQQRLLQRPTLAVLERARWVESATPAAIEQFQFEQLRRLLLAAAEQVPFYRGYYNRLELNKIVDWASFKTQIPTLDKSLIRGQGRQLVNDRYSGRLTPISTGGSTGSPLTLFGTTTTAAIGLAAMIRSRAWWGVDFNDRSVLLIEHGHKYDRGLRSRVHQVLRPLHQRVANRLIVSAYDLSPATLDRHLERIARFKPTYLVGYSTALYLLSKRRLDRGEEGASSVRALFSTSEMVLPVHREVGQAAWAAPVVSEYGAVELGIIAHECPSGSMHTMDDVCFVETIPLQEDPEFSEVVVTTIGDQTRPLIRYRTGDLTSTGRPSSCQCGRGLSVLGPLAGRAHDLLYAADGTVVHGQAVTHIMNHVTGVRQFQLVQRSSGALELKLVIDAEFDVRTENRIRGDLSAQFGAQTHINITFHDDLPAGSKGKFRWIIAEPRPPDPPSSSGA